MAESASQPVGRNCVTEQTRYDSFMDREYTTVTYEHEGTGRKVIINDVYSSVCKFLLTLA